jgi:YVTN family beta-propeller protein
MLYAVADAPVVSANKIFGFAVGSDGALTWPGGFPVPMATGPVAAVPSRDGTHLYALASGTLRVYAIRSDGSLDTNENFPTITNGLSGPSALAVSPDGTQLYVANSTTSTVVRFPINGNGSLPEGPPPSTSTKSGADGIGPVAIAMSPDGAHLYTADAGDDRISVFDVAPGGALTLRTAVTTTGSHPAGLAITPDGTRLYATNSDATSGSVSGWVVAPDGSLSPVLALDPLVDPAPAGAGARGIAISPDGNRLLTANAADSKVSRFIIGATGALTPAGADVSVDVGARSIAISHDGKHAYVGGATGVEAFDLSAVGGLTKNGQPQPTNASHPWVTLTPNQAPQAKFNAVAAYTGAASTFQGGPSSDDDGTVASWTWDFGDGTTGDGVATTHVYQQAGRYTVTLTVRDNEGCSVASGYNGQSTTCAGSQFAVTSQPLDVLAAPPPVQPEPACIHDGDDGFCGTADHKAPIVTVLGFNDGASITTLDAPQDLVGSVTPDPSGVTDVLLRFSKAAGTVRKKKTTYKRVCHKVKGKRKKSCKRKKVVKTTNTKVAACLTVSGTKNYLVKYLCAKVPWVTVPAPDGSFRYSLPVALGIGAYTLDVVAVDGAGNRDVLEGGRNHMSFKIINTPSNAGDGGGGGTTTTPTTTTPVPPVTDTGSPFGR